MLRSALFALSLALATGCSSPIANVDPTGKMFPTALGKTLEGVEMELPADLPEGEPAILLLGYVQKTQFDCDRWLIGLLQSDVSVPFYEVPTIPGWAPRMFSENIDDGMRSGIPMEDYGSVVTIYGKDAKGIVEMTGNEVPRNARVVLLDAEGRILWFHDRGFSAGKLVELADRVREL